MHIAGQVTVEPLLSFREGFTGALVPAPAELSYESVHVPVRTVLDRAGAVIDAWLSVPDFTCCTLSSCLEVTIDGRSWTDLTFDHFWHQTGWFYVVSEILEGADGDGATTFVWDESCLGMHKRGDRIEMSDARWETFGRPFAWRPVSVPMLPFVDALLAAGETVQSFRASLRAECARRGVDEAAWRARLDGAGDQPRFLPEDVRGRLAVIAREMDLAETPELARLVARRARIAAQGR
jgi:hypothetical protein